MDSLELFIDLISSHTVALGSHSL